MVVVEVVVARTALSLVVAAGGGVGQSRRRIPYHAQVLDRIDLGLRSWLALGPP